MVTHFVEQEHVRQVRFQAASGAGTAALPATLTGEEHKGEVTRIDWSKYLKDDRYAYEVELRPNQTGTVFVSESSPVIIRTEATVQAATSLEMAAFPVSFACPTGARCPRGN